MKICPVCSTEYSNDTKFCPNDGQTLRAAAPASDLVGQVIADRYHVIKKLGEGGMGQVYLAEHVKMGRRSAIKVMNPSMIHDPDAVARFNREAANASRITHPNVCAVYDFGETPDGVIYLAMEFIEGEPLTDLIEREGALKLSRAVRIFQQTADALQVAHDLGIVHRDLKPDNIMLARARDGGDIVKVVDFGIAKAMGGDEAGQKVTKTGLVVGTPEFMSPEQLSGDKLDGRSDLYSLALVLYRMVTGKLPFEASTVQETMIKRLTDEPMPLATARPDLSFPPALQPVMDKALARTPGERYQSVAQFSADVGQVVGTRPSGPAASDAEGKTQLIGAADKTRIAEAVPPTRVATVEKKRGLLVPMAVGIVVLALAGGGYAVFGRSPGPVVPGGVTHDTTGRQLASNPNGGDTTKMSKRDTTGSPKHPVPRPGGQPGSSQVKPAAMDSASLQALADRLPDMTTAMIVDSAVIVYNAPLARPADRGFAACALAQAYQTMGQHPAAVQWANKGLSLTPNLSSCRAVLNPGGQ